MASNGEEHVTHTHTRCGSRCKQRLLALHGDRQLCDCAIAPHKINNIVTLYNAAKQCRCKKGVCCIHNTVLQTGLAV